ncbi:MAG: site-2 protease family protein [Anaerolineae bacterium]|nr:site-2 protease family protein [Anaerolineae bacterium]
MSLSESVYGGAQPEPQPQSAATPTPRPALHTPDPSDALSRALDGILIIQSSQVGKHPRGATVVVFQGKLMQDAEAAYPLVEERFRKLGYTPMMEKRGEQDAIFAVEGIMSGRKIADRPWLHLLLLVATIITTTLSGAQFTGIGINGLMQQLSNGNFGYLWRVFTAGAPFALTLLLILGVHEMGHYIAARRHGVSVTLPFFIPVPLISLLGTLGAVIFIRSPLTNRKQLFDVGISGPLAGFVVALIAFIIGLNMKASPTPNMVLMQAFGTDRIGMPILLTALGDIFRPNTNLSRFVTTQPIAFAAWFGMFLTVLNLIPMGQLDGGHVMYTLFGRAAWTIAYIAFAGLLVLGTLGFYSLIIYALLGLMTGLRHPPPNNDITPLDWRRRLLGYATILLFFLIVTPNPFPAMRGF